MQQRGQRATASAAWPNKPRKNWTLFSCHQEFYPFFFTSGLSKCIRKLTENSVASLVTLRQAHPVHDFDFYAFYTHCHGRGSFQLRTGVMISFAPWLLLPFHRCRCCCPYLLARGTLCAYFLPHIHSHTYTHTEDTYVQGDALALLLLLALTQLGNCSLILGWGIVCILNFIYKHSIKWSFPYHFQLDAGVLQIRHL